MTIGVITTQHTVWCGICCDWDQSTGTTRHSMLKWRRMGWKHSTKHGWICPRCAASLATKRTTKAR